MGDVFIRKTTGFLMLLSAVLAIVCVALIIVLTKPENNNEDVFIVNDKAEKIQRKPIIPSESTMKKPSESMMTKPTPPKEPWEADIRIPTTTMPIHYDLLLHPDLNTDWFTGKVTIQIDVKSQMSYLLTHVKEMNISSTTLTTLAGRKVDLLDYFEYKPHEFWVVRPENPLQKGNYSLTLEFNGSLKGHIVGFYKSEYTTKLGEKRAIATSKFQPTDARRAFPCFDEPSFKSTFSTSLIRPAEGYIALSNMHIKYEIPNSPTTGLTRVVFHKSVPMVTYLACFIVCDFDYVETPTASGKPFRVYATKDQINRTHYARDLGVHILNHFEKYFEVEYPLPKQDMIAIPDFSSGAMEHWGLITYREANLLFDDVESSSYNKQRIATIVSHELAHMWFGNLATLKWWDDLWLNEGFASYIEYKGVSNYEKDWDMEAQFVVQDLQPVFQMDEILSSHPIVQEVSHPDEITEIFDKISYSKGASVLRMLENFIGAEKFRVGVRNFLRRFKYDNAITQDLWDDLQGVQTEDLNITRIMSTWTNQMGFPVVTVKKSVDKPDHYDITQERFLIDPDAVSADDSPFAYVWDIPLTFKTNNIPRQQMWLNMGNDLLSISKPAGTQWIKMNVDQFGYYRVNYDNDLWNELITLLKTNHEALTPPDRSSLIDDAFSLAAAGRLSYNMAFDVISYIGDEVHYIPWVSAYDHITAIGDLLANTEAYSDYRKFVLNLVGSHAKRVGWTDDGSHLERRNRIIILKLACAYGHGFCLDGVKSRFAKWIENPSGGAIPANHRNIVYYYGIQNSGEEEWETLLQRFADEINAQEKIKMLYGLTATKEVWIANRLLNLAKNESVIRKQDYFSLLSMMARNPTSLPAVWDYLRNEWSWMVEEYGLNTRYLGRAVQVIATKFTTPLQLKDLERFFSDYPEAGSGKRARVQAKEGVEKNIKWIARHTQTLTRWLQNNAQL